MLVMMCENMAMVISRASRLKSDDCGLKGLPIVTESVAFVSCTGLKILTT